MELRSFVHIFFLHRRIFLSIVLGALLLGALYTLTQPQRYHVSLTLNVARTYTGNDDPEETYSSYYRLQADERFADTIVRWLQSPRVVVDILTQAQRSPNTIPTKNLQNVFHARRLSSQVVDVAFTVPTIQQGKQEAQAIEKKLNTVTQQLNNDHQSRAWFKIISEKPVIYSAQKSFLEIMIFSLFVGVLGGFVSVVFVHYYLTPHKSE